MSDDPGFYADWHFVQNIVDVGTGICPAAAILTDAHGTLHDDDGAMGTVDCTTMGCGSTDNAGYADNQNCYTTIQAPAGEFVRFTFTRKYTQAIPSQFVSNDVSEDSDCL